MCCPHIKPTQIPQPSPMKQSSPVRTACAARQPNGRTITYHPSNLTLGMVAILTLFGFTSEWRYFFSEVQKRERPELHRWWLALQLRNGKWSDCCTSECKFGILTSAHAPREGS